MDSTGEKSAGDSSSDGYSRLNISSSIESVDGGPFSPRGQSAVKPYVHTSRVRTDGQRVRPRRRDAFLSLDAHLTKVDTMQQTFSLQGKMTMMIDLSAEDAVHLQKHGGIDPFPEETEDTTDIMDITDKPKVLKALSQIISDYSIDMEDDHRWWPSPYKTNRRRTALQSFRVAELDDSETQTDLKEWLPISPHRLFKRHRTSSIATWPCEAMVYSNTPRVMTEQAWNQEFPDYGNILSKGGAMLSVQVRFEAVLLENFELRRFPFDRQLLHIACTTRSHWNILPPNHVKVEQWAFLTGVRQRAYSATISTRFLDGWRIGIEREKPRAGNGVLAAVQVEKLNPRIGDTGQLPRFVECRNWSVETLTEFVWACGTKLFKSTGYPDPHPQSNEWFVMIPIEREPKHYLLVVCVPVFIIVTMSWSHMCLEEEQLADKLSIILTMLLTAVAFQVAMMQMLPEKPYSTLVDSTSFALFVELSTQPYCTRKMACAQMLVACDTIKIMLAACDAIIN